MIRLVYVLMLPLVVIVAGLPSCEDRFRYPCQDPRNWETPQCQKPQCEVTQTCPEHVYADQRKMQEMLEKKDKEPSNECPK